MALPRPMLNDMPYHIKEQIFGYVKTKLKTDCRLLSKSIKDAIDKTPVKIKRLEILLNSQYHSADIVLIVSKRARFKTTYSQKGDDVHVTKKRKTTKVIGNADYFTTFINEVNKLLAIPRIEFRDLVIKFQDGSLELQDRCVASLSKNIKCQSLKLEISREGYATRFQDILNLMNPSKLTHLSLSFNWLTMRETDEMGWLMKMDVCGNLKKLEIDFPCHGIRLANIENLELCHLHPTDFTMAEIKRMKAMCLENGKINFLINCRGPRRATLRWEFGIFTNPKTRTWIFENPSVNTRFQMRAYEISNIFGTINGCVIMMKSLEPVCE